MLLPIVMRELRVQARQPATYHLRLGAAALGSFLIVGILLSYEYGAVALQRVFLILALISYFFVMIAGGHQASDCISEERRNGTLGFLFLTHLRGHDVVLGKLAARGLSGLYSVLALFPSLALLLLVGGVGAKTLFEYMLSLLNAVFVALANGAAMSAMFRTRTASEWMTGSVLGTQFILLPVAGLFLAGNGKPLWITELLFFVSPIPSLEFWNQLIPAGVGLAPRSTLLGSFWISLVFTHLMAWLGLGLAGRRLAWTWKDADPAGSPKWRERWRQWRYGSASWRLAWRRQCLGRNPFFWLAARDQWATAGFWWLAGITVLELAWMSSQPHWRDVLGATAVLGFFGWSVAPKFMLASGASARLATDRRENTLELMLSTPLTVKDIISGQWMALGRQYRRIVLVGLAIQLATIGAMGIASESDWLGDARSVLLPFFIASAFFYVLDLWTIGWVGMWQGLRLGDPKKAASFVAQSVLFLPGTAFCILIGVLQGGALLFRHRLWDFSYEGMLGLWCVLGVANDVIWTARARAHLWREFRNIAAQPLGKPAGFGAWGRWLGEWMVRRRRNPDRQRPDLLR